MPRPSPQTDRVVAVIELLSSGDEGATMTEIARHLSINPATCVHVMAALTSAGVVVREPDRRYHLGPALALPGRLAERRYPLLVAGAVGDGGAVGALRRRLLRLRSRW
ncbi:MAG: helix-turn-helix domain-containing protein [Microthrixaceae bacterium]